MLRGPIFVLFDFFTGNAGIMDVVIRFFAVLVILFVIFPVHECAHALAAKWLGDKTAERAGRITLNPFAHIDPMGAIFMFIMSFGWAKPVPVNPRNCHKVGIKAAVSLTAAAGPISNVIMSLLCIIIAKTILVISPNPAMEYVSLAFRITAQLSVYLAVFNLIPIPPLDGSKILFFFLKDKQVFFMEKNANIIRLVFLALIFFPPYILSTAISFVGGFILMGLDLITWFIK
ncbi:MAG: site-2 protease family protein [Oscillospiraceae bacterium]|nr:site-2 protease family protein [Oscillospiraceae bacterium]